MDEKTVKIISVGNAMEAEMIMEIFRNNNIPCFKQSKGSGGYMNIYMGYSIYGEDIYVGDNDVEAATVLLDELESAKLTEDEETNDDELLENVEPEQVIKASEGVPFYKNQQVIARIILAIMIGSVILAYLLNNL